jgi:hypothetical protein
MQDSVGWYSGQKYILTYEENVYCINAVVIFCPVPFCTGETARRI